MENYFAFSVDEIVDNSVTDFNLYVSSSNEYILYASLGYHWFREELERLIGSGFARFYTEDENKSKVRMYKSINHIPMIDQNLPPEERITEIEKIGAAFTEALHKGELTPSCVHKASTIATSLTQCILENEDCVSALESLADHDQYVLHHSMRVATYSTAIALKMGLTSEKSLTEIAFGGIFHDIGKSKVDPKILHKNGPLNDKEWEQMRSHPGEGFKIFKDVKLGQVPQEIILHHHEKLDGSGYPDGLDKNGLLPEVQIATLADIFDALTSTRSYQKARTKMEALEFIKEKMVGAHINPEVFFALVSCLS